MTVETEGMMSEGAGVCSFSPAPEGPTLAPPKKTWRCYCKPFVNKKQSPAERRAKYLVAVKLGAAPGQARRLRDFRTTKFIQAIRCLGLKP